MKATALATALLAVTAPFAAAFPRTYGPIPAFKDSWVSVAPGESAKTHGTDLVLKASTEKFALLGFTLPSEVTQAPNRLLNCELTLPPFNTPVAPLNITMQVAVANAWDEVPVNGDNRPGVLGEEFTFYVEDTRMPIRIDATEQCKIAAAKGTGFSLYIASPKAPYEFKSRETGMGATLVATAEVRA
ncbi:hypothetical protein FBU59_001207 [Linderina macrospora]|uniref:Uncharacterized protein n=1 Tax=Linderina macrospora TaxID=4868 RepID=A0ACC1JEM8_9FUNG|nr:hypothetical protein FBU59_001207 [Linderina macrospora]